MDGFLSFYHRNVWFRPLTQVSAMSLPNSSMSQGDMPRVYDNSVTKIEAKKK